MMRQLCQSVEVWSRGVEGRKEKGEENDFNFSGFFLTLKKVQMTAHY